MIGIIIGAALLLSNHPNCPGMTTGSHCDSCSVGYFVNGSASVADPLRCLGLHCSSNYIRSSSFIFIALRMKFTSIFNDVSSRFFMQPVRAIRMVPDKRYVMHRLGYAFVSRMSTGLSVIHARQDTGTSLRTISSAARVCVACASASMNESIHRFYEQTATAISMGH